MKYLGLVGWSVVVAASLSSNVMAEDAKPHKGEKQDFFKKADANGDGKLSLDEFKTMAHGDAEKKFTAADTDKDGFLTREELKAARAARHEAKMKAEKDAAPAATVPVNPVK